MKVFIDCGAMDGRSVKHFRKTEPKAEEYEIYCFEPLIQNLEKLRMIENITVIPRAVSTRNGVETFYKGQPESGSLLSSKTTGGVNPNNRTQVLTYDLSQWILDTFKPQDEIILKLNVEGSEYAIIEKMYHDGTLKRIHKLYVNWHWNKIGMTLEEHERISGLQKTFSWRPK